MSTNKKRLFLLPQVDQKIPYGRLSAILPLLLLVIVGGPKLVGMLASRLRTRPDGAAVLPFTHKLGEVARLTYRQTRRVVILILGSTVLLFGIALIILPGPAILIIPIGLAILAVEFTWAQRLLNAIRDKANGLRQRILVNRKTVSPSAPAPAHSPPE
jgi:tellurite resistance protein TerC